MARKKFEELSLNNAFLFAAAMQDAETCQMVLEIILGRSVSNVAVHVEHTLLYSSDFRAVRLDVYASENMEVAYNLEMENWDKEQLPKRSRFHQAEMDVAALKPGEDFSDLKPSYVIFICTFDPFGYGLYRYTFENRCLERDFGLGDECCRIFLSTKGTNGDEVPKLLVDFLRYVEDSSDACAAEISEQRIEKLHEKIRVLKKSRTWEAKYMTVEEYMKRAEKQAMQDGMEEGMKQGMKQGLEQGMKQGMEQGMLEGQEKGQQRLLKLIELMSAGDDAFLIPNLAKEETLLKQMYEKYHL